MRLSVSNIAWQENELEEHLSLLKELGCDGVEIAPSCIWKEPVGVSSKEVESFKKIVLKYGLTIPALHALLFKRPDLYLFGSIEKRQETILYLKGLISLAGELSAKVLIYGSSASRKIGDRDYAKCYEIAVEIFRELAAHAQENNTIFCIEPLSLKESDFINTAEQGYRLVRDVGHSNFGLHLDLKAMIESKEDIDVILPKYASIMRHFHISEPGLVPVGNAGFDHSGVGKIFSKISYNGFVSIEMRRGFGDSREIIKKAVEYVRKVYF